MKSTTKKAAKKATPVRIRNRKPEAEPTPCDSVVNCETDLFTSVESLKVLLAKRETLQGLYTVMQHQMDKISTELRLLQIKLEASQNAISKEVFSH